MNFVLGLFPAVAFVLFRFLPHPGNFSPVLALVLYSAYRGKKTLGMLCLALVVSDVALGWDPTLLTGYLAYAGLVLLVRRTRLPWPVLTVSGSTLFFVLSNFGVWLFLNLYPKTWAGLLTAYQMGIPFYRTALVGDLVYAAFLMSVLPRLVEHRAAPAREAAST